MYCMIYVKALCKYINNYSYYYHYNIFTKPKNIHLRIKFSSSTLRKNIKIPSILALMFISINI